MIWWYDIKLKIQFLGLMLLTIWMVKKLLEVFMKKNYKRLKKNLKWERYLKEKVINYMLSGKAMIIASIVGVIKKISYKNQSRFS